MSPAGIVVRSTTFLLSALLVALSITVFYTTGDASKIIATHFPPNSYSVWVGNLDSVFLKKVRLDYVSSDDLAWLAAGFSIAVGVLSIVVETVRLWRHQSIAKYGNATTTSKVFWFGAVILPAIAFVVSLAVTISVNVQHRKVGNTTCNYQWDPSSQYDLPEPLHDKVLCTKELAVCKVINYFYIEGTEHQVRPCVELKITRHALIPLTVLSGLVALSYGLQLWLSKRETEGVLDAEERVRRLEEEE